MSDDLCPTCGQPKPSSEPVQITARVVLDDKVLATAVNRWNRQQFRESASKQIAEFRTAQAALDAAYNNDPVRLRADADALESAAREKRRRADEIDGKQE